MTAYAYRYEVDDNDGQTNPVEVALQYTDSEYMTVKVGDMFGKTAHLDIAHAIQLRDAIDEALMLMTVPADFYPVNALPPF